MLSHFLSFRNLCLVLLLDGLSITCRWSDNNVWRFDSPNWDQADIVASAARKLAACHVPAGIESLDFCWECNFPFPNDASAIIVALRPLLAKLTVTLDLSGWPIA